MIDKHDLAAVGAELLVQARASSDGRATRKINGSAGQPLHQLLLALDENRELSEHTNPGQASLYVLQGSVVLRATSDVTMDAGEMATIPDDPHSVLALRPSVMLLTLVHRTT